jgi:hypothetical protein
MTSRPSRGQGQTESVTSDQLETAYGAALAREELLPIPQTR